jgi:hypothetical protein
MFSNHNHEANPGYLDGKELGGKSKKLKNKM